jgi:alkanesulfonate monooxygenase SsuD/methylene tetrahydromethanopterin reductase-like flavin-dependent oxidoreductase (luciferase family)
VSEPFAPGSVSFRAYPHEGLEPVAVLDELRGQAALATEHGFAGVMTSEHHGGFPGYLPNPLQLAGFLLDAMRHGWAAPCPLLLPLRPPGLVAEEVAWLAARFPGRVGLGVAAGALPVDFEIMDTTMDDLTARFASGLAFVTASLRGDASGPLAADPAIARCREHPVPVLSAANSVTAAKRAARAGAGLLFDSLVPPERARSLVDAYRAEGGTGACVLVRRAWVGEPPRAEFDRQVDVYRGYAPSAASQRWGSDEMITGADVRGRLHAVLDASGCTALNIRIHVPGISPHAARDQIEKLGSALKREPA